MQLYTFDDFFRDMVKSGGAALPEKPIIFMKPTSSLIQENQDIIVSNDKWYLIGGLVN